MTLNAALAASAQQLMKINEIHLALETAVPGGSVHLTLCRIGIPACPGGVHAACPLLPSYGSKGFRSLS